MPILKAVDGSEVDVDFDANHDEIQKHYSGKGVLFKTQKDIDAEKSAAEAAGKSVGTRSAHEEWEKDFAELLGEQKPDGVKGVQWAKSKVAELAEKAKKPAEVKTVKDEVSEARIKELDKKLKDLEEGQTAKEKAAMEKAKNTGFRVAIKGLSVDGENESERSSNRELIEMGVRRKYDWRFDEDDEVLVPYDKEGNVAINPETTQPYTIDEVVTKNWPNLLAKKKEEPKKTGTNPKEFETKKSKDGIEGIIAPSELAIFDEARKRGLVAGSKEHKEFVQASKDASGLK